MKNGRLTEYVPILMTSQQRAELEQLAQATGRSQAGVMRQLLALAALPEIRQRLGVQPEKGSDPG